MAQDAPDAPSAPPRRKVRRKRRRARRSLLPTVALPRLLPLLNEATLAAALVWAALAKGGPPWYVWTALPLWILSATAGFSGALDEEAREHGARVDAESSWLPTLWILGAFGVLWAAFVPLTGADLHVRATRSVAYACLFLLAWGARALTANPRAVRRIRGVLLTLACFESFLAIAQGVRSLASRHRTMLDTYPAGTYANHNHLAGLLEICLPLAIAWALDEHRPRRERLTALAAAGVCLLGLIVTLSRGGWVAGLVGLVVLVGLRRRAGGGAGLGVSLGVAICLTAGYATLAVGDSLSRRVEGLQGEKVLEDQGQRGDLWRAAIALLREYPATGVGAGNFRLFYAPHREKGHYMEPRQAHNDFLQAGAELGLPGLLVLLALFAIPAWVLFRRSSREESLSATGWIAAALAALASLAAHGLIDFNLQIPANAGILLVVVVLEIYGGRGVAASARPAPEPAPPGAEEPPPEEDPAEPGRGPAPQAIALAALALLGLGAIGIRWLLAERALERYDEARITSRPSDALPAARAAVALTPRSLEALRALARGYEWQTHQLDGRLRDLYAQATADVLDHIVTHYPTFGRARIRRARLEFDRLRRAGQEVTPVLERMRAIRREFPNDPVIEMVAGGCLLAAGLHEEAESILREAFGNMPLGTLRETVVRPFLASGDDPVRLERLLPDRGAELWAMMARAFEERRAWEGAERCWLRARDADPGVHEYRIRHGLALLELGRVEDAAFEVAVLRDQGAARSLDLLDVEYRVHAARGRHEDALAIAEEGSRRFSDVARWKVRHGNSVVALGDLRSGRAILRVATEEFSEDAEVPLALARVERAIGEAREDRVTLREACSAYREALQRNRDLHEARRELGVLYHRLGDVARAAAEFEVLRERGVAGDPELVRLADHYLVTGRFEVAASIYDEVVARSPDLEVDGKSVLARRMWLRYRRGVRR